MRWKYQLHKKVKHYGLAFLHINYFLIYLFYKTNADFDSKRLFMNKQQIIKGVSAEEKLHLEMEKVFAKYISKICSERIKEALAKSRSLLNEKVPVSSGTSLPIIKF